MLRLETFGGLRLTDPGGTTVVTQPHRLALLALLASAGRHGLRRDKVLAALWPESTTDGARHALQQMLYAIRRQTHEEIFRGTDPLELNPDLVSCDLWEFESAIASEAPAGVLSLHAGPFLDGFFLDHSPEFEEWTERERSRLAGEYGRALSRLARESARLRQHTLEIDCWRRLSSLEPLSERAAVGLIRALAGAGDVAEATRYARDFDARIRRELNAPPATDLAALIERTRLEQTTAGESATPGETSRYVIERELGRGSVATVYLARDTKLGRPVALKVLQPELARTVMAKRFIREIDIAASLYHPHILQLHDAGELPPSSQGQKLFYVMPYVDGESLRDRLRREIQLPVGDVLRLGSEIAGALDYAHQRGVVHRDIKPENILLQSGHALVADFGIARALELAGGERLSMSGVTLGTPGYMSPEQAVAGAPLDGRSDIYSLGCVLYELLGGETPFSGRTSQAILARHARDPVPPLRTLCPEVPAEIEAAIERALAKNPADRFATAAAFAEALRRER
jgi:DNA-binding SARP family transcriptional activator